MVRGRIENNVFVYRGVPYGMDTAKTRFAPPKPAEAWAGIKECATWGPRTIQLSSVGLPQVSNGGKADGMRRRERHGEEFSHRGVRVASV